jgi:hypothetical protein
LITFEWIIGLLLAAVVLSALARRLSVPYPTFLAVGGALLTFVPASPSWTLDPKLALALFVAPVLLDAGFDTSLRDLRANWLPVSTLVIAAVGVTTAAVAVLVHSLLPDISWPAAIALGAIVAPPDAAAAITILRQDKLPHRLMKVLEGESLLNDASALLIYRIALGAETAQHLSWTEFTSSLALVLLGSLVAGYVFSRLWLLVAPLFDDAPSAIILQFVGAFTVWIVADEIGVSGILTTVVYAMLLSRDASARMCSLGDGGFHPERARLHPDRHADRTDLEPARQRCPSAIFRDRRFGIGRGHSRARRLDRRFPHRPVAGPGARPIARSRGAGNAIIQERHRRVLVRHARHRHSGDGICAAGGLSLPRPDPVHGLCGGAGLACDPGSHGR